MKMSNVSEKKNALMARKQRLLQEIKHCESEIEEVRFNSNKFAYLDEDSSDSDTELSIRKITGPSEMELKCQERMLKTCLKATQELTNLEVLQSEVNVLVEDPKIVGEKPITEEGVWREVTAECRIDLVPFSITFYTHKPSRKFGQISYRGLRVVPVKTAHEAELAKSVLPGLMRPSDAVEVLCSYAEAQRSRRTTLARLADKFSAALFMEPLPGGGYKLKCADLMEVSWTLQNKWSPIAPFHQRMKFDLEYMDEYYIQTIKQAHRQLSDPSLDTSERTQILSKIISTCLEAQGPTQELYESMSSDQEAAKLKSRRTTLDKEPEIPSTRVRNDAEMVNRDKEVMAPPKSLPKKGKNKVKRSVSDAGKAKKIKMDENNTNNQVDTGKNDVEVEESVASAKNGKGGNAKSIKKKIEDASAICKASGSVDKIKNKNGVENVKNNKASGGIKRKNEVGSENDVVSAKLSKISANKERDEVDSVANTKNCKAMKSKKKIAEGVEKYDTSAKTSKNSEKNERKNDIDAKSNEANAKIGKVSNNEEKNKTKNKDTEKDVANANCKTSGNTENIKNKNEDRTEKRANSCKIVKKNNPAKVENTDQNTNTVAKNNSEQTELDRGKVQKTLVGKKTKNTNSENTELENNKVLKTIAGKKNKNTNSENTELEKNKVLKTIAEKKNKNTNSENTELEKEKVQKTIIGKRNTNTNSENTELEKEKVQKPIIGKKTANTNSENTELEKENVAKNIAGKKVVKKTNPNSAGRDSDTKSVATSKNTLESNQGIEKNKPGDNVKEKHNSGIKEKGKEKVTVFNNVKNTENVKKIASVKNSEQKIVKSNDNVNKKTTQKVTESVASEKIKDNPDKISIKKVNTKKDENLIKQTTNKNALKILNKQKTAGNIKDKVPNIGNTEKENNDDNKQKNTKLPMKKLSSVSEGNIKKVPLRISPRKLVAKGKMPPKFLTNSQKTIQKPVTAIPRLMAKPKPKIK